LGFLKKGILHNEFEDAAALLRLRDFKLNQELPLVVSRVDFNAVIQLVLVAKVARHREVLLLLLVHQRVYVLLTALNLSEGQPEVVADELVLLEARLDELEESKVGPSCVL